MSSTRKITLKSCDGETFEVEETVSVESQTLKNMIDDGCADGVIPLPNVTGRVVAKVIEYCRKETEPRDSQDEKKLRREWDAEFIKVGKGTLFDLILAANYLNIKGLLDLTCQTVADMIKDMKVEEVRNTFNIKSDFTPEEEEAVKRENRWAYE